MQIQSYPTETLLSNKITRNKIVLSFKDSPGKPLGRRPNSNVVQTWVPDDGLFGLPDDVHEVDLPLVVPVAAHREVLLQVALVLHEPPAHLDHLDGRVA